MRKITGMEVGGDEQASDLGHLMKCAYKCSSLIVPPLYDNHIDALSQHAALRERAED
jgi:hypothetical protein